MTDGSASPSQRLLPRGVSGFAGLRICFAAFLMSSLGGLAISSALGRLDVRQRLQRLVSVTENAIDVLRG